MSRVGGLAGWTRLVATCLAALAILTGATAVLGWHESWILTSVRGPLEAFDFAALGLGFCTVAAELLDLDRKSLGIGTLFFALPARLVAAGVVAAAGTGVACALVANRKASGFHQAEPYGSCWIIEKNHGSIARCVSHHQWLAVGRLDQLGNIAGLAIALSVVAAILAVVVLKASDDDGKVKLQEVG